MSDMAASTSSVRINPLSYRDDTKKGPWWQLFSSRKGLKYRNNQTHAAAFCNGCLKEWVRREREADREGVRQGDLREERKEDTLREIG